MEKQFVPYELAVKLKELGFDEPCFGYYKNERLKACPRWVVLNQSSNLSDNDCVAPLWQQAFYWFREKHGIDSYISNHSVCTSIDIWRASFNDFKNSMYDSNFRFISSVERQTYSEARQSCLEKLIEVCKIN